MAKRFRDFYKFALPSRFRTGDGELVQYSVALLLDMSLARIRAGLEARFPSKAGDSALAMTGADRAIRRGRTETRAHYAQRLIRWRWPRGHRVRGSDFALLEQVSEYFGGMYGAIADISGNIYTRGVDGALGWAFGVGWNWDGAPASPNWGRFWIAIDPSGLNGVPGTAIGATPAFGAPASWLGRGVPGQTIGFTGVTTDDFAAIRALMNAPTPWKPAGTRGEWLIVNVTGTGAIPDGTWGRWSKVVAGVSSAARYNGWRYVSLSPETNNVYTPDVTRAVATLLMIGTSYTPSALTATATITLPDGTVYTPDATRATATIKLVDDGSQA